MFKRTKAQQSKAQPTCTCMIHMLKAMGDYSVHNMIITPCPIHK